MEKKARSSIYKPIPAMAIVPIMLFGLLVLFICSIRFNGVMHEKVEDELENIAASVAATYDTVFPGEYDYIMLSGHASPRGRHTEEEPWKTRPRL